MREDKIFSKRQNNPFDRPQEKRLRPVLRAVSQDDSVDLLISASALQLVPENADRLAPIEALVTVAASKLISGQPIDDVRLKQLLDLPALKDGLIWEAADLFENPFVEEVCFGNGSYRVFPGAVDRSVFELRIMLRALAESDLEQLVLPETCLEEIHELIEGTLRLSDAVANRAGYSRGMKPVHDAKTVVVPSAERLVQLKAAVVFSDDELTACGISFGSIQQLKIRLGQSMGSLRNVSYKIIHGPLIDYPLIDLGDRLVVALPQRLMAATILVVLERLNHHGQFPPWSLRWTMGFTESVLGSLTLLGHALIEPDMAMTATGPLKIRHDLFRIDDDCVLSVLSMSDWPRGDELLGPQIGIAIKEARGNLAQRFGPMCHVLSLFVTQPIGRSALLAIPTPEFPLLCLRADELDIIAWSERGDPLALWRFARAAFEMRQRAIVVVQDTLDEYAFYRKYGGVYPLPSDPREIVLALLATESCELRCDVSIQLNRHGVPGPEIQGWCEVERCGEKHNHHYRATDDLAGESLLVQRDGRIPLWILIAPHSIQAPLDLNDFDLQHFMAYWLDEAMTVLTQAGFTWEYPCITTVLYVVEPLTGQEEIRAGTDFNVDSASLHFALPPVFFEGFKDPTQQPELFLASRLLAGLIQLSNQANDLHAEFETLWHQLVPSDSKRVMLSVTTGQSSQLDHRGIDPIRFINQSEQRRLQLLVGSTLIEQGLLKPGRLSSENASQVLKVVVEVLYNRLVGLMTELTGTGLLERLLLEHEAVRYQTAFGQHSISNRLQTDGRMSVTDSIRSDLTKITPTGIAVRFLIEYVTASPPTGGLPISDLRYDELLALGALIVQYGLQSDLVQYQLAKVEVGLAGPGFFQATAIQYTLAQLEQVVWVTDSILVENPAPKTPELNWSKADTGFHEAFGFTLTTLFSIMNHALNIGDDASGGVVVMDYEAFVSVMARGVDVPIDQVHAALGLLALQPRASYLDPPKPFRRGDVWPWQFNRNLALVRRPFLIREATSEILWGNRTLESAKQHWFDNLILGGRLVLPNDSRFLALKQWLSRFRNSKGNAFNHLVATQVQTIPGVAVRLQIRKLAGHRLMENGQDLGDIDVLVANPKTRQIIAIECKNFVIARTPLEVKSELETLLGTQETKEKSSVYKHTKRLNWLERNLDVVLKEFQFPATQESWTVHGIIVTSSQLVTPRLQDIDMPIMTLGALLDELKRD
jgi:hypothetical protein